jgi:translation initiation factor 4E
MTRGPSREGYIKGYKDVPSLSAIRERMGSARQSISEVPAAEGVPPPKGTQHAQQDKPAAEGAPAAIPMSQRGSESTTVSDSTSQSTIHSSTSVSSTSTSPEIVIDGRKAEHSLRHAWTLFFDAKSFVPPSEMVTPKEGQGFLGDYEKSLVTVGKFDTVGVR